MGTGSVRRQLAAGVTVAVAVGLAVWSAAHAAPQESALAGWPRQIGTAAIDRWWDVATTGSGDVYAVGSTGGAAVGASQGSSDVLLARFDATGTLVWLRQFGTSGADSGRRITVVGSAIYVAGETGGVFAGATGTGGIDGFVARYATNGNQVWVSQFGTSGTEDVGGLAATDGAVFVSGGTTGAFPGTTHLGELDGYLMRFSTSGTPGWVRQIATTEPDSVNRIAVAGTTVYVIGQTGGTLPGAAAQGGPDAFVARYTSTGTLSWLRQFGTAGFDTGYGISVSGAGVFVTGTTSGAFSGYAQQGDGDSFVGRYDTNGNPVWVRQIGTGAMDTLVDVATADGAVFVAGSTFGAFPGFAVPVGPDGVVIRLAPDGTVQWTRQMSVESADRFAAVALRPGDTNGGGVVLAGSISGTAWRQSPAGSDDTLVTTVPTFGDAVPPTVTGWPRQFGTAGADEVRAVATSSGGDVYLAGRTTGTFPGQTNKGAVDAFLARLDKDGRLMWVRQWGTTGNDDAAGVALGGSGIFVTGTRQGAGTGDDAFVARYDLTGNLAWIATVGTPANDRGTAIGAAGTDIYVTGQTAGTFPGSVAKGGVDGFVARFAAGGTQTWVRQFGTAANDTVAAIAATAPAVFVGGNTAGAFAGASNQGDLDGFVARYAATGTQSWVRQLGTSGTDLVTGLDDTWPDAGIYVAGSTTATFPGAGAQGGTDGFLARHDTNGNQLWLRQFGTSATDTVTSLAGSAAQLHVGGSTTGAFPGFTNQGSADGFVLRYDTAGTPGWTRQFGTPGLDRVTGVALRANNSSGGIVVTAGWTAGTIWGQTSAGSDDAVASPHLG